MRNTLVSLMLVVFTLTSSCSGVQTRPTREAQVVLDMLDSTVLIEVNIAGTAFSENADGGVDEYPVSSEWSGSGVVYGKSDGLLSPIKSKILTAHHVLAAPKPGDMIDSPVGPVRVDAVLIVVKTRVGKTCELTPVAMGNMDIGDVATGVADCDAGKVAEIANSIPSDGSKIFVSGHPLGVPVAIVTEGYVSGWLNGFLLISAGAFGGNSGGPVFYDGKVIGLLVRGSGRYHHISMVTPLAELKARVAQTK